VGVLWIGKELRETTKRLQCEVHVATVVGYEDRRIVYIWGRGIGLYIYYLPWDSWLFMPSRSDALIIVRILSTFRIMFRGSPLDSVPWESF
jgi:hypothetical protein